MSETLRSVDDLVAAGLVSAERETLLTPVAARYAVGVTPIMAALIDRQAERDPIARQFVPDPAELVAGPHERADPIGDAAFSPVEGVVHRYPDRVLLKLLHVCPVYCRFCFRREAVGPGGATHLDATALDKAFAYVAAHPEIWEVILTGGDPLILSPRRLADVARRLAAIPHVKILRLHSRVPCVAPERIDAALIDTLRASGKSVYVALHANHPRELGFAARAACGRLVDAGIPLLSQSVLLRGVNDDVETLSALMRAFVETRVKPYYLHHLDAAPGTAHFRVPLEEGLALVRALIGRVSGLCQPRYVLDIPGGFGKAPLGPAALSVGEEAWRVEDFQGRVHAYPKNG
jgi:lysine 2,3-aminomutase